MTPWQLVFWVQAPSAAAAVGENRLDLWQKVWSSSR
jgi:hypothetical protein